MQSHLMRDCASLCVIVRVKNPSHEKWLIRNKMKPNLSDISKKSASSEEIPAGNQESVPGCNENYHFLFEQATDAIMVTDFRGNFKNVNSSLCNMFGYTKEELLQMNVRELLDAEHLEKKPIRFDRLAAGENIFNERMMVHKNCSIIYVEANSK